MGDERDGGQGNKPTTTALDVATPLPSESQASEPGAIEIRRETRETIVAKRIRETREVVRIESPSRSISIDKLADPALAQALLDERNYWRDIAAEREESITTLQQQVRGLTAAKHQLDKRSSLAEQELGNARRTAWLEGLFIAIGGALFGVSFAPNYHWALGAVGMGMMLIAALSGLLRSRSPKQEGQR
jgi:hypothetical protein